MCDRMRLASTLATTDDAALLRYVRRFELVERLEAQLATELLTFLKVTIDGAGQEHQEKKANPLVSKVLAAQPPVRALRRQGMLCPWLFFRGRGKPVKSLARAWRTACRLAGAPDRVPHDFRRTAVRNLERAGVPRKVAMLIVGHRTEAMYRRYDIVTESDLHAAAVKLNAAVVVTKSVTVGTNAAS